MKESETLRELELEIFAAVGRGETVVLDPILQALPGIEARLRDLVIQLSGRPRATFIHLKTAGDILRTFAAIQAWRRTLASVEITFVVEEPYGELAGMAAGIDHIVEVSRDTQTLPAGIARPLLAANFGCEARPAAFLRQLDPLFAVGFQDDEGSSEPVLVDERNPARAGELVSLRNRMNRWHFYEVLLGITPDWTPPLLRAPTATHPGARVVQFGAGSGADVWAPKRSRPEELAGALSLLGGRWLAVGGREEAGIAAAAGIADADNYCGRTTWTELAALLAGAELYIGHDSGPTHLAAALGIPTLALFGFTSPILNAPIGPKTLVAQADMPCAFGGCRIPCPETACTVALTAEAIAAASRHLEHAFSGDSASRLASAAVVRAHGLRTFYPGHGVEDLDPLRHFLEEEPRIGPPRDPALALVREWLESTAR